MTIKLYRDTPFDISTQVDLADLFIGNGVDDTFTLTEKDGTQLAASIQFDNTVYYRYNGGFTVSGDDFTLSSTPPSGSQGVAPGLMSLVFNAFDTDDVPGVTDPRVQEVAFYIGNAEDIYVESYAGVSGAPGIELFFTTLITADTADDTWLELASANPDGTASAYSPATCSIYTLELEAFGTLLSSISPLASSISVCSTDTFYEGDYIRINPGGGTDEVIKILSISGSIFTTTECNYSHSSAEGVFACVRKMWARLTVPEDATSQTAQNFLSVGLRCIGITNARF